MSYNGLAYTYDSVKDYKKAIKYYMQAIELLTDSNGVEKRELALVYENLCITYCNEMQWSLAYEYVQKAYNIYLKVLGRDHQQTMACKQLLYNIMMSLMQKS